MDWRYWIPLLALAALAGFWHLWRIKRVVHRWARRKGVELLTIDYDDPPRDHAWYRYARSNSGSPRTVVRISVRLANGQIRHGWALCGGDVFGLWRNKVEIDWDQPLNIA